MSEDKEVTLRIPKAILLFIDKLKEHALSVTFAEAEAIIPLSKEAKQYETILRGMRRHVDGNHVDALCKIFSVLTGETITAPMSEQTYQKYLVVVPRRNPNSHNYTVGQPVMLINDLDYALKSNGNVGNHLPDYTSHNIRKATGEEVAQYFNELATVLAIRASGEKPSMVIEDFIANHELEGIDYR